MDGFSAANPLPVRFHPSTAKAEGKGNSQDGAVRMSADERSFVFPRNVKHSNKYKAGSSDAAEMGESKNEFAAEGFAAYRVCRCASASGACGDCRVPGPQGRGQATAQDVRSPPRATVGKLLRALRERRVRDAGPNHANTGQRRGNPATSDPRSARHNGLRRATKCQWRFLQVEFSPKSGCESGWQGRRRLRHFEMSTRISHRRFLQHSGWPAPLGRQRNVPSSASPGSAICET